MMCRILKSTVTRLFFVIFGLALVAVWQSHKQITNPYCCAKQDNINRNEKVEESLWAPSTYEPITTFTLGLVVVAAIQAGLFFDQLRLMRHGMEDAKAAAAAAKAGALAAKRSADYLQNAESACLFIERDIELSINGTIPHPENLSSDDNWLIRYSFENLGKTLGIILAVKVDARINAHPPTLADMQEIPNAFLPGNITVDSKVSSIRLGHTFFISPENQRNIESRQCFIYFFGCVRYLDVFRIERETGFSTFYDVLTKNFTLTAADSGLNYYK